MGLSATFRKAAKSAFNAFGDLAQNATYIRKLDNGIEDPSIEEYSCKVIVTTIKIPEFYSLFGNILTENFSKQAQGNLIQPEDLQAVLLRSTLSVEIRTGDILQLTNEKQYSIVGKKEDPANALYILWLRKTQSLLEYGNE